MTEKLNHCHGASPFLQSIMVNDSDTESESEISLPTCSVSDFPQVHRSRDIQESDGTNSAQNAAAALEALRSLDLEMVLKVCPITQPDPI